MTLSQTAFEERCRLLSLYQVITLDVEVAPLEACVICMEAMIGDSWTKAHLRKIISCGHIFHDACIAQWLTKSSATCPLCRTRPNEKVETRDRDEGKPTPGVSAVPVVVSQETYPDWLFQFDSAEVVSARMCEQRFPEGTPEVWLLPIEKIKPKPAPPTPRVVPPSKTHDYGQLQFDFADRRPVTLNPFLSDTPMWSQRFNPPVFDTMIGGHGNTTEDNIRAWLARTSPPRSH